MTVSRWWLALVLPFCLPLFFHLGQADAENDEAIYSFAVDRILETGDWLEPKSSPQEDVAFLEKPPLKFWMVAAPIRAGLLPHDDFGLRFWDAAVGSAAFLYVFAMGAILAGPICGLVAVFVLFVHAPLVFGHGLRNNEMDGALFLAYCGGIYHFARYAMVDAPSARIRHAVALSLYVVLGFLTKFVAVLFLPITLGVATLLMPAYRRRVWDDRRLWMGCVGLFAALSAPWFLYASARYGLDFWRIILLDSVLTRFTTALNPAHIQPWYFYAASLYREFAQSGLHVVVFAGLAALLAVTYRRRWPEGALVLLWFVVPLTLASAGSSKLYHYAYPLLPPLALAAGYVVAVAVFMVPVVLGPAVDWVDHALTHRLPGVARALRRPGLSHLALVVVAASLLMGFAALALGPLKVTVSGIVVKNSSWARPTVVALILAILVGRGRATLAWVALLMMATLLPVRAYRETIRQTTLGQHPMRSVRDCVLDVESKAGLAGRGLYVDAGARDISHPMNFYFRRVRPWTVASPDPATLDRYLYAPGAWRPALLGGEAYTAYRVDRERRVPPSTNDPAAFRGLGDTVLLLPGPYARCLSEARFDAGRPGRP